MQFMFTNYLYNLCTYTRGEGADFLNLPTAQWKYIIIFLREFIRVILKLTMQLHDAAHFCLLSKQPQTFSKGKLINKLRINKLKFEVCNLLTSDIIVQMMILKFLPLHVPKKLS
jgi:hypothetical protein